VINGFNQAVPTARSGGDRPDLANRRRFLRFTALTGLGIAGVGALGTTAGTAFAGAEAERGGPGDRAVLNLMLNMAYLTAELVLRGSTGGGLAPQLVGGAGRVGPGTPGRSVPFARPADRAGIAELAQDQRARVARLREVLGPARVARPAIDLDGGLTAAAATAGLIRPGRRFAAFSDEPSFLLGAYLLVNAEAGGWLGALPLLSPMFRDAVGSILVGTATHAGGLRSMLRERGLTGPAALLVPADASGGIPALPPGRLLGFAYQSAGVATAGGFFPWGVNGELIGSDPAG